MLKKFGEKKKENKNKKNMYVIGRLPLIGYSSFVVSFHFIFFFFCGKLQTIWLFRVIQYYQSS